MQSFKRHRRLRTHPGLRELTAETRLSVNDFVMPLFIHHEDDYKKPIPSMPDQYQLGINALKDEIKTIQELAIPAVILFGIPSYKDATGTSAWQDNGVIQKAIPVIKEIAPDLLVITDLCCCEYTDHAHCGALDKHHSVDNDATLDLFARQAISHAHAGSDIIAPSGMMDGMVATLRNALDGEQFTQLPILSYAAKYCSGLYGPFRDAADSTPKQGSRAGYQMNPSNTNEALSEVACDIEEGADMVMVKPAGYYLDVIHTVKQHYPETPLAAYQVSGEYATIKAAAEKGWIDERRVMLESLTAIKRAGANFIISYFSKAAAKVLK